MRKIIAVVILCFLGGCGQRPEEPRDSKVPRPKTDVIPTFVHVEPFQAGSEETRPLIMRAVLRCHLDAQGKNRCELEVPRPQARMG